MTDKQRIADLEAVIEQFLKPIKDVPFSIIIKSIAGHAILPMVPDNSLDAGLLDSLIKVANLTAKLVEAEPIQRPRPNEVGNDIEPFVMKAANQLGLKAERPRTAAGNLKSTGYPDIIVHDQSGRPTYIECKIFAEGGDLTTMRSFYLSPSDDFKVTMDARHILMAFGMEAQPINGSRNSNYRARSFKIVDLYALKCDVKYEFNSDNQRLYADGLVLAEGKLVS